MAYQVRTGRRVRTLALTSCLLLFSSIAFAEQQSSAPAADHSQEAVVFETIQTLYRFEKDGTGRRENTVRLKAQSEAGVQAYGQLLFGYNAANERPEITFVRVHKADGTVVTTPPESVQDLSSPVQRVAPIYTDFRQKHVTVQSLRPGDTLEFKVVTTIHTPLAADHFWAEYNFQKEAIVLDEQLIIDLPADRPITLKTQPGFDADVREAGGRRTYRWTRSNLQRPDVSAEKDANKKKPDEPEVAAVRLTTFQDWDQVGRWFAGLERPQRTPTPEIRRKAAELVEGRSSDLEKIEALYTFVSTNFRYVSLSLGAGRYQPRAAADVLREQYGDCKDKHTLLASLSEALGFQASAVLINSEVKLDPVFPSPSQFDHVITKITVNGQEIWLDTTPEVAPFRLLSANLRKKQSLVVERDAAPHLQETPADPPMETIIGQDVNGKLAPGGQLTAAVALTFRGDVELLMRMAFRNTPAAQWKTLVEGFVTAAGSRGDVSNLIVSDPADLKDPFTLKFDFSMARFADWTSSKISVSLPMAGSSVSADAADGDDSSPVQLGAAPTQVTYKLRLALPSDVTARPPLPVSVARDYAEYRTQYSVNDSVLSAERRLLLRQSELPGARRQDYAAFLRVVAADARQTLALETSAPVTPSTNSSGLKASELSRSGYEALTAQNYEHAVSLLERAVALEPNDKHSWNNLGRAYAGLRRLDDAIGAYRKQIEVNAYDPYAYNNLGRAYAAQRKFQDAEAAFLKQLEVNPLDEYSPANLGGLYVEQRRYEEAIPYLEKAAAFQPKNAWIPLQLGKAHLNLKHENEAIAAFDRAVELSPTPGTWNDIAYELALKGVHLDRAQRYAESAVTSMTAASRTLEVTRADATALTTVSSLAAYWDTLGWVYFVRGDLARAERLIEASWRLGQHGEVADHLGQVFEKLGRSQDALRMYELALVASRPHEDSRERLERLSGRKDNTERLLNGRRADLAAERTTELKTKHRGSGTADFLILFSSTAGVEDVRFVSGEESLRPLGEAIRTAAFPRMFPDESPAKTLRRGIVACSPASCSITLMLPDDVQPVK